MKNKNHIALNLGIIIFYAVASIAMITTGKSNDKKIGAGIFLFFILFISAVNFLFWELNNKEPPVKAAATLIVGIIMLILNIK